MHTYKKLAFTIIELVIVVAMIGILIMATTMYLGGGEERKKTIEGLGCAATLGGEINNFVFYTLTSRNLRLSPSETVSPEYYIIEFTGGSNNGNCSSGNMCNKINFSYSTGSTTNIKTYKTIDTSSVCKHNNQPLRFYRSGGNINYIVMNKGFSQKSNNNKEVFYLKTNGSIEFYGDVIIGLCLNSNCSNPKEIGKFVADSRPQTVTLKNCRFYDSENPTKCKEREK